MNGGQAPTFSEVFERDNRRCVYCGRDLMHDFDSFMITQMDHLTPTAHEGNDDLENTVTACCVCNNLKGDFDPPGESREERLASARRYVMKRRAYHIENDFSGWL